WTPCAGPVLAGILTLAVANDNPLTTFGLLVTYAVGAALPMLVIAYGGRYLSGKLLGLRTHAESLQRVGGVLVAASAVAILLGWDMQIQLLLAPFFPSPSL
ncbi:MAG: cytochrome c biogenesis protein CcdA, partial [Gemmatimonadaceae bacterium]|nr:cytochrome c biogenesis protein CcdA [Gloeobacterales cyanobacterium ES-bin-141]